MRLYKYLLGCAFIISMASIVPHDANAQFSAYANAGVGYYGGLQACPYIPAGGGGKQSEALEEQIEKLEEKLEELRSRRDDILNGNVNQFSDERLPIKPGIREALSAIVEKRRNIDCKSLHVIYSSIALGQEPDTQLGEFKALMEAYQSVNADPQVVCNSAGVLSAEAACKQAVIYNDTSRLSDYTKTCQSLLNQVNNLNRNIAKLETDIEKVQEKLWKVQEKEFEAETKALVEGRPYTGLEACPTCGVMGPEPTMPSGLQIGIAAGLDVLSNLAYYKGSQYISKKNAALGWATPPWWAGGVPGPMATMSLFASHGYGGGMGAGAWGCSPGAGYPMGPNGMYGNPFGMMSPYGMCGGAFGSPCGGYGYPGFGGQFGVGGMGPFAGYPGMTGFPGVFPGMFPGFGVGAGVYAGIGGPGMGGLFPGMMGGLGGGIYGGMGFPGMMGGMGGLFPGMGGGLGMGGVFPGMMGGMGYPGMMGGMGYPGMMGGMGAQYQMQLMQMQMQQQQAYMQAQARAMQNQQVITQQLYSLQMEMMQIAQRAQYLQSQLSYGGLGFGMGAGVGLGVGINFGLGAGYGVMPYTPTPGIPLLPGSTSPGTTPAR